MNPGDESHGVVQAEDPCSPTAYKTVDGKKTELTLAGFEVGC